MPSIGGYYITENQLKNIDSSLFIAGGRKYKRKATTKKVRIKSKYPKEYKKASKRIRERAGNVCEQCKSDYYCMVHHINKDTHDNELDNLILLCFNCHKKHHFHLRIPYFMKKKTYN